jgi:curved DNA-binding protein CbpA
MADFYEVLGVARTASAAEIRQAYLRLAKERHPDRFSDPVEKERAQQFFKELTAAFNALGSDKKRRSYDAELEKPKLQAPEEIARDAFARAGRKLEEQQLHEAVELLRIAVHHVPGEARYHASLGRALARNPQWVREAIQEIERATQLAPGSAAYHAELAGLLHAQGLKIRARKSAEAAVRIAPNDPEVARIAAEVGLGEPHAPDSGGLRGLLRRKP